MQLNIINSGSDVGGNTNHQHKYRNYTITINNPTNNDIVQLQAIDFKYLIYQYEKGDNGTLHLQGTICFSSQRSFNHVKELIPKAHIEPCRNLDASINYCSKEDTRVDGPFEFGKRPKQGERTDLQQACSDYLSLGEQNFARENSAYYVRYFKGLKQLQNTLDTHRTVKPIVTWLWGLAGSGKTRQAFESHSSCYIKDGSIWWDGYNHEEAIIIDDFEAFKWPYRDFLRLLDRYPYQGQIKGGYVKINSPYIYITCENPPVDIWNGNELDQVTRRLNSIIHKIAD